MGRETVLVLGVGNVLLGDEGVGVHAVRRLEEEGLPPGVVAVDGGTGGFHLLSLLQDHAVVVFVDATLDDQPAGSIAVIKPRFASDFPRVLSAHDIGLRDLVESAALLGSLPQMVLVTISVESVQPFSLELSAPLKAALPRVIQCVREALDRLAPTASVKYRQET